MVMDVTPLGRFRVVGVHVTQFKHQLTLQDQLEVGQHFAMRSSNHSTIIP